MLDTPLSRRVPAGNMIRPSRLLATTTIALISIGLEPAVAAGAWKYQVIPNDGHVLTYTDDGKVTFYLGCGRGFALAVKYPGAARQDGAAHIVIANAKDKMEFDGEFEPAVEVKDPVPMNFATEFHQNYLGFAKQDPRVYGKKWLALRARLYALLGAGDPLTVSAGKDSYELPRIDAANWRKPFERCGLGDGW